MQYYQVEHHVVVSRHMLSSSDTVSYTRIEEQDARQSDSIIYFSNRPAQSKSIYSINHPAYFADLSEDLWCLDTNQMNGIADLLSDVPQWLIDKAYQGNVTGIISESALYQFVQQNILQNCEPNAKNRVHIIAMGDVGGTMLIGLTLLGGDVIDAIGIYDFNENLCKRWEHEMNQIAYPWQYDRLPRVEIIDETQLFDCDVFVFCASKSIPAVGSEVGDVRMAQLEANRAIIAQYGQMARKAKFQGLFAVVSDPVDLLCRSVYEASNMNAEGTWDGKGLRPEQVQGYGLGVMNSRAAYYAKQDDRFAQFLAEGRAYGPHGSKLVIADSITHYNHALSLELTQKAVEANLEVRGLGYKPYIAPALSSAAISILLTLRGEWHYSSNFLGGIYMGAKNRTTAYGLELEHLPLPNALLLRLKDVQEELRMYQINV